MHRRQKHQVFGGQARRCLEQLDVFFLQIHISLKNNSGKTFSGLSHWMKEYDVSTSTFHLVYTNQMRGTSCEQVLYLMTLSQPPLLTWIQPGCKWNKSTESWSNWSARRGINMGSCNQHGVLPEVFRGSRWGLLIKTGILKFQLHSEPLERRGASLSVFSLV